MIQSIQRSLDKEFFLGTIYNFIMDTHNYYFLEDSSSAGFDGGAPVAGENAMIEHMCGGADGADGADGAGEDEETFVAGYEADGSLIEGFAGKKKLKKKLRKARRRARRAENALANNLSTWWGRNNDFNGYYDDRYYNDRYYNDRYYNPVVVTQPVYTAPVVEDVPVQSGTVGAGGAAESDNEWPWVVFASLVFVMFVMMMMMIVAKK